MKRVISLIVIAVMLCSLPVDFVLPVFAAETAPPSKLISVAYSSSLDLYVTVANDGQLYTSGDGLHWGKGEKISPSTELGNLNANKFNLTPTVILWNPELQEFVLTAGNRLYRSVDGFHWGESIEPKSGDNTLTIHTLFWDGQRYWAATTANGQVALANDRTLTSWTTQNTGARQPIDGFAVADSGRIFVCTTVSNGKTIFYTDNRGKTWTDGTESGLAPYRTTSMVYLKKLEKIAMAGGNGSKADSTGTAAIGRTDVITGRTEAKLELKSGGEGYPQIPVISEMEVYDTFDDKGILKSEEILAVSFTGMISYRLVGDANDLTKNRKWKEVQPAPEERANTAGLIDIIHGKDGFVAVGGDPSNKDRGSETACGTAIFIPNDYTQGYRIGTFDDGTQQIPTTLFLSGKEEVGIPVSSQVSEEYQVTVRDQCGKEITESANIIDWTIEGGPYAGISVSDGVLTVTAEAKPQRIVIRASDRTDPSVTGTKEVLISAQLQPTAIVVSGNGTLVKSEIETRTANYTAEVLDQLGRPVPAEGNMDQVVWSIEYPAENAAAGLSIDRESGELSIPASAEAGDVYVVATSGYAQSQSVQGRYSVHITTIGSVSIAGPASYTRYFRQCTKTPCTYTFVPTVLDADGKTITEECEYSIIEDYFNPGVSIDVSAKGECVITLRSNTVSDVLTLKASAKNAPDVFGTYKLYFVDTMVPNGDLFEKEEGSNVPSHWTNIGELGPDSLGTNNNHGRWIFKLLNADQDQIMSYESDPFPVVAGVSYQFGFRSQGVKLGTFDEDHHPVLYMTVQFLDQSGKRIGSPTLINDTLVLGGAAHSTAFDFYQEIKAPDQAAMARVTMGAAPPIEFNLFDIGCYPMIDSGSITIDGKEIIEAGASAQMNIVSADLVYNEQKISLPDGVKWFLKEDYDGVSIDVDTGLLQTTQEVQAQTITVCAVVSGKSSIRAEKTVTVTKPQPEVSASEVKIITDSIMAGAPVEAMAKVNNTTDADARVMLIVAVYDSKGILVAFGLSDGRNIPSGGVETEIKASANIPEELDTSDFTAKAFLWDSMRDMSPVKQK